VLVSLSERSTGRVLFQHPFPDPARPADLAFSPDGRRLAVGVLSGPLTVLDSATGEVVDERSTDGVGTLAVAWSQDGATLYAAGTDGVVRFLEPASLAVRTEIPVSDSYWLADIVAVPHSTLLAVASSGGPVTLVDTATRARAGAPLAAGTSEINALAASPQGDRLAAVSSDGNLHLWDRASGRALGPPLRAHAAPDAGVTFLEGGRRLLTSSADGSVTLWDMSPDAWARRACQLAGRDLTRTEWTRYLPDQPYRRTCAGL
jgi:WD40 repeat protein